MMRIRDKILKRLARKCDDKTEHTHTQFRNCVTVPLKETKLITLIAILMSIVTT